MTLKKIGPSAVPTGLSMISTGNSVLSLRLPKSSNPVPIGRTLGRALQMVSLSINDVIREAILLVQREVLSHGVSHVAVAGYENNRKFDAMRGLCLFKTKAERIDDTARGGLESPQ